MVQKKSQYFKKKLIMWYVCPPTPFFNPIKSYLLCLMYPFSKFAFQFNQIQCIFLIHFLSFTKSLFIQFSVSWELLFCRVVRAYLWEGDIYQKLALGKESNQVGIWLESAMVLRQEWDEWIQKTDHWLEMSEQEEGKPGGDEVD